MTLLVSEEETIMLRGGNSIEALSKLGMKVKIVDELPIPVYISGLLGVEYGICIVYQPVKR